MRLKFVLRERWVAIAGILLLLMFTLKNILDYNMIHVCGDEFGYWANAAYWNGADWSSLMENTLYYSYGYSVILFLITLLPVNMSATYQIAIALNVVMLIAIYFLVLCTIRLWFSDMKKMTADFIALITVVYPSFTVYTQLTFCETLIVLLYWMTLVNVIKLEKSGKYRYAVYVILLSIAGYIVHQRNLGVLCGSVLVVGLILLRDRIKIRKYILLLGICILLFGASIWIKNNLSSLRWISHNYAVGNNYSSAVKKVSSILGLTGIKRFLISFLGKLFYMASASFLLVYIGFANGMKEILSAIKRKILLNNIYSYIWTILVFVFSIGIASIFLINGERMDVLIYGRYSESAAGALIVLGIAAIYNRTASKKNLFLVSILYCTSVVFLANFVSKYQDTGLVSLTITGVYRIMSKSSDYFSAIYKIVLVSNLISILLFIANMRKKGRRIDFYISLLIVGALWILNANCVIKDTILASQQNYTNNIFPVAERIQENENVQRVIYVIEDRAISDKDYNDTNVDRLQYLLWNNSIERIEVSQLDIKDYERGTYFVLIKYAEVYNKFKEKSDLELVLETGWVALFQY